MSKTYPEQPETHYGSAHAAGIALLISALEAGLAVWAVLRIPADIKNAVLLGLSAQRLILTALLVFGMLACLVLGFWMLRRGGQASLWFRRFHAGDVFTRAGFPLLAIFFLAAWLALFTPPYQLGRLQAYFERLQPLLAWFFLAGFQISLALLISTRKGQPGARRGFRPGPALLFFAGFLLVWAVMGLTGLGLKPDSVHWNDAGAPILMGQVMLALMAGLLVNLIERLLARRKAAGPLAERWIDVGLVILIWGVATFLWIRQPLPHSFFAPGPYPPNYEPYPFSDASGYDLSAQFALIGQGLMNKGYVDKPLYSGLLVLLHTLAGQEYFPVINLQTALIALFPALLYFCGARLHSRGAGAAAAFLAIFREINSIGATLWILSSSTKVMMSEPLTMLGIGFFTLFLILWARQRGHGLHWLAAAGGSLGLTTLVRHNPWMLIPAGLTVITVVEWKNWRRWLLGGLVFLLAFGSAIAPWMIRNQLNNGKPFYFLVAFEGVVMAQRYETSLQLIPDATPTAEPGNKTPIPTPMPGAEEATDTRPGTSLTRLVERVVKFVPAHFFHNILVTAAIFPSSFFLEDLEHTIKAPGSIWDATWTGGFEPGKALALLAFLGLLAAGLGSAWKRWRWAGILPGFIYVSYNLATAVARTSGARYMQPADWAALFYLALGLMQAWNGLRGFFRGKTELPQPSESTLPVEKRDQRSRLWMILLACAVAFSISGMVTLSEWFFPIHFPPASSEQLAAGLEKTVRASGMELDPAAVRTFLENEQAVLIRGRALYPRYYGIGEGEPDRFSPYRARNYPRLVITVIGQEEVNYGVLPLEAPPEFFPNGSDVILLGCAGEYGIDLAAIAMTGPREQVLLRSPATELGCPLAEPVCDDNRQCR